MKAVVIHKYGDSSVLVGETIPKPTLVNENDILVKINAIATNPVDYKKRTNYGNTATPIANPPVVLGWDASGVVECVGSSVTRFKVGDEVFYAGEVSRPGCYAEYQLIHQNLVGKKPKSLTFEQAASLPLTAVTAWEGLLENMAIPTSGNEKKAILVIGGAGGVGSIVIQIAKKILNLIVIATASRVDTQEWCKKMGADFVINHTKPFGEELKRIGIPLVEYVYDCVDANYIPKCPEILKPFGVICCIVAATQPISMDGFMGKRLTLTWELMFARTIHNVDTYKQGMILDKVSALVDSGVLKSTETKLFQGLTASNLQEAHVLQESGKSIGKIVIKF